MDEVTLPVLTLDVQNDEGDPRRPGLIHRELRRLAPDVVALQEVCYPDRSGHLAELLDGTGLHATHHADLLDHVPAGADRYGGTAIATRRPHHVREVRPGRTAGLFWWTLAVSVGDQLIIVPTTPWELDAEAARQRQTADVTEMDDRHRGTLPTIVAGDLNASPDSPSIRSLSGRHQDAWAVAGHGPGHTWSVDNPLAAAEIARLIGDPGHRRRIDYILVAGGRIVNARLVADRPVDGVWLGDHAGVLVDLRVSPGDRRC